MVNDILGERYEIQQPLAKKAGRRTLLARDLLSRELVVVKLLTFSDDFEWDDLKLFEREAQTLKALSHPAIPRYLDYLELEAQKSKGFALVQTYVAGKSLEEYLQVGRTFAESDVKEIALALLQILAYLHERQPPVVHRDIKPSNILLGDRSAHSVGQVYLVDFGSVQTLAATRGGTITVVGTYGYMPPEQFGDRTVPASDLYSLGATLIAVVTGSHPADLPQKDGRIQFEHIANISPTFADWLKWMTEPCLERRLKSASFALQALEKQALREDFSLVATQPAGSRVVLTKKHNYLEIIMPPKGLSCGLFLLIVLAVVVNTSLVPLYSSVIFIILSLGQWLVAFVALPFLLLGLALIQPILLELFGQIKLHIDQEEITLNYQLFGLEYYYHSPAPRQQIIKLEQTRTFYKEGGEGYVEVKPQINIWAGTEKFEIGGDGLLSKPELDWLAHELSDWLELPISSD
jgi:hypothetical protein